MGKIEEYDLRGLETTVAAEAVEQFMADKWSDDLQSIPRLGPGVAAQLASVGVTHVYNLIALFLDTGGDLKECLDFMRKNTPSGTHYKTIVRLVLAKLSRTFTIKPPPENWREMLAPKQK
jgi:hypothetical protein